jgi:diguanylate cyclase (GGDEF)-like protein
MIFILISAIVGELAILAVVTPLYGFPIALLVALGGGVLAALGASTFLYARAHALPAPPNSGEETREPSEPAILRNNRTSSPDDLTRCLDRAALSAVVDSPRADAGSKRDHNRGAFLSIDVDQFGSVNEHFGRSSGDEALRLVAGAIRASVRSGDLVARLGRERFGVLLPGASRDDAANVAERLRRVLEETVFEPGGERCRLTVSVGGVVFEDQLGFDDLSRTADEVLLTAKKAGSNRTELRVM